MEMLTENHCDGCDEYLHAVVDTEDFFAYKVGRIRCSCGYISMPCNECPLDHIKDCPTCPYKDAEIVNAMSAQEYVSWLKKHENETYQLMLKGEMGETYQKIAKETEETKE